jgi:NADPH-dependent curcumin reductase CurA
MIIAMRIKMQGFIVFDYAKQFPAARKEITQWLAEGKLQRKETIIKGGLPAAEQALLALYKGVNTGKFCIDVIISFSVSGRYWL